MSRDFVITLYTLQQLGSERIAQRLWEQPSFTDERIFFLVRGNQQSSLAIFSRERY
jgi:hypothetical protein